MSGLAEKLAALDMSVLSWVSFFIRFLLPILGVIILERCVRSLLREKYESEEWGQLILPNNARIPLNHWENIIGRSAASDVLMDYPTVSRSHSALIRNDKGEWTLYDLESKGGVELNGRRVVESAPIKSGDVVSLAGVELVFVSMSRENERQQAKSRRKPGRIVRQGRTLAVLTEFQILLAVQLCIAAGDELTLTIPAAFAGLILLEWLSYIFTRSLRRVAFEVETLAFFLCSIGMAVCASSAPSALIKQLALLTASVVLYFIVGTMLRNLDLAKKMRWPVAAAGLLLLAVNLVLSEAIFGAKNWLTIGGFTFQPSEFVKLAFVFAGSATLDRLFARRNLIMFIGFAGACVGALALMSDFGTALVFFVAYLVIAFLRSGDFATIFLSVGGAGFAGFMAITLKSHIAARFATWGHAWEVANDGGYQQTRTMSAASSGGLFGLGAGKGWLKDVFAADTDLVFGMVCEELGLIVALLAVSALIIYAIFTVKAAASSRSSFYVIGACASASIMIMQIVLNILGSVDILPLTGVTFPFISRGGSSLISCWGLLAFIKANDTRQNASFVVKMPKKAVEFEPDPIGDYAAKFRPADAGIRGEIDYGDDMYYDYDREAPAEPANIEDKPAATAPADIGEGSFSETVNEDFEVSISYTDEIDDVVIDDDYFR